MQIFVTVPVGSGFSEVATEHQGKTLKWNTGTYSKVNLQYPDRPFKEINAYLKQLPIEQQNNIWNAYVKINEIMQMTLNSYQLIVQVNRFVRELFSYVSLNDMRTWLLKNGLFIPGNVERAIDPNGRYDSPQTYLEHDYINLAAESLAIRLMVPIWGEYLGQEMEQDLQQENELVSLLQGTELFDWPNDQVDIQNNKVSTVFDKLLTYISFIVKDENNLSRLWRGLSSIEIPINQMSRVIVRRLSILPLDDHSSHSLVSNIYQYISKNVDPIERSITQQVKDKNQGKASEDDDKKSFLENNKAKAKISGGDTVVFNHDAMRRRLLIDKIDPTVPDEILLECEQYMEACNLLPTYEHQEKIAQWVMAPAFSARAFGHITHNAKVSLITATQAILWHWGYLELACLMQVERLQGDIFGFNPRAATQIQKRYREKVDELFPYNKQSTGKVDSNESYVGIAISTVTTSIRSNNWIFRGNKKLFDLSGQLTDNRVLVISDKLKPSITELVIKIGERNR